MSVCVLVLGRRVALVRWPSGPVNTCLHIQLSLSRRPRARAGRAGVCAELLQHILSVYMSNELSYRIMRSK